MSDGVKVESLPLDGPMPERLASLLRYWKAKRAGRPAPAKTEMDPVDFPQALAHCLLAAVEPGTPPSFHYVIVGEGVHHVHQHSLKGMAPEELQPPAYGALIRAHYLEAVATCRPLYHAIYLEGGSQLGLYLRLLLPLTDAEGGGVTHLLAVEIHEAEEREDLRAVLPEAMRAWLEERLPRGR